MQEIKKNFKSVLKDRAMISIMASVFIFGFMFFIFVAFNTKYHDLLIHARYTIFGSEHFYKDSWAYRIPVAIVGLIVAFLHNIIIAKIYAISGKKMAIFFAVSSVVLLVVGMIILGAAFREIPN